MQRMEHLQNIYGKSTAHAVSSTNHSIMWRPSLTWQRHINRWMWSYTCTVNDNLASTKTLHICRTCPWECTKSPQHCKLNQNHLDMCKMFTTIIGHLFKITSSKSRFFSTHVTSNFFVGTNVQSASHDPHLFVGTWGNNLGVLEFDERKSTMQLNISQPILIKDVYSLFARISTGNHCSTKQRSWQTQRHRQFFAGTCPPSWNHSPFTYHVLFSVLGGASHGIYFPSCMYIYIIIIYI